ncbi:MAG: hypothetical protein ABJA94_07025 [Rhodoglobus sp.]
MSRTRTLATAAASAAVAAALTIGVALPANAGQIPVPNPSPTIQHTPVIGGPVITTPITPYNPGPSIPLPPGYTLPTFSIPSCTNMVTDLSISATAARYPGFGPVATPAGAIAADAATLQNFVRADRGVTCAFGVGGVATVLVTETAISAADYKTLLGWYNANSNWSHAGGGPTIPGGATDTQYAVGAIGAGLGPRESATISPNGWWITVKDAGNVGALPYFEMDTVERFFELNPRLALITH